MPRPLATAVVTSLLLAASPLASAVGEQDAAEVPGWVVYPEE